ncbi:hypothetical protein D3C80_1494370 [compost metagenome]
MQDHHGVLARLDHFVEVTDAPFAHRASQRPVLPPGALGADQVPADQVGGAQVIVARHGVQRQVQAVGHVLDEAGLATARGALDQDRHAVSPGLLEQRLLIIQRLVEGFDRVFARLATVHGAPDSTAELRNTLRPPATTWQVAWPANLIPVKQALACSGIALQRTKNLRLVRPFKHIAKVLPEEKWNADQQ